MPTTCPTPVLTVGFDQIEFPFGSTNAVVIDALAGDGFPATSLLKTGSVVGPASLFYGPNGKGDLCYNDTFDPVTGNYGGTTV
jgi:hypothetical protein